ncbi:MAG: PAS domain S-box protein [Chloroflexi bacterium]|nr:PAS domain S-box protein [Chloroflexota bacterium]
MSFAFWNRAEQLSRVNFLDEAQRFSQAINLREFERLTGSEADLSLPEYLRLKHQLVLSRQTLPDVRFLYLMGEKQDGSIFFFIDSEPVDSDQVSPPGQIYQPASGDLRQVFQDRVAIVEGPVTDGWGTWMSALVPVIDPTTGEVVAVFGMDIDATVWRQKVNERAAVHIVLTTLIGVLILCSMLFLLRRSHMPLRHQLAFWNRHAEAIIVMVLGAAATALLAWSAHAEEQQTRLETFSRVTSATSNYISSYFRDLENYHLSDLANFFEASDYVTQKEFLTFTASGAKDPKVEAWAWAPVVFKDDLDRFERLARLDGMPAYEVWEKDQDGERVPVLARDTYYPVLYLSPVIGNLPARGFDIYSEPVRKLAIDSALKSRLITATDPIEIIQETEDQVSILVLKPVFGTSDPLSQKGFLIAVLRMGNLLTNALGVKPGDDSLLNIEMYALQEDTTPVYLASNSTDFLVQTHIENRLTVHPHEDLVFLQPIYAFGKVYLVVAHPNAQFLGEYPVRAGWFTALIGVVITLLAASVLDVLVTRKWILEQLVTERTAELHQSEQKYRALAESTSAVLWEYDPRLDQWVYIAPQVVDLTGWQPEEWTNLKFWTDRIHPEDRDEIMRSYATCLQEAQESYFEYRFMQSDGGYLWIQDVISVELKDGDPFRLRGFMLDISERKWIEETLHLQSTALQSTSNAIIITNRDGKIIWANPAFLTLSGYEMPEVIGETPGGLLKSGAHPPAFFQAMWKKILAGETWHGEIVNCKKDGSIYHEEMTINPVKNEKNEITHFIAVKQDISERKLREREFEAIASMSEALRSSSGRADMLPILSEKLLQIVQANGSLIALRGKTPGEKGLFAASGIFKPDQPDDLPPGMEMARRVMETGKAIVAGDPNNDDPKRWFDLLGAAPAAVSVPLQIETQTIGALLVGRDHGFAQDEVQLLNSVAAFMANILQRETLREDTQQQLERLATLRAIDQVLASGVDIKIIFKLILEHVIRQLNVDAAAFQLFNPYTLRLQYADGRGFRTRMIESTNVMLGDGVLGAAAFEQKTIGLVHLTETNFVRYDMAQREGFVSYYSTPMIVKGQIKGVLEVYHRSPMDASREWLDFLEMLAGQTAIAIDNSQLFEGLQRSNIELSMAYDATIEGWSRAMDLRDEETEGHTERVTELTMQLARLVGVSEEDLIHIRRGALLHDMGKLGVPDRILLKPGALDEEEWKIMRQHPVYAYNWLSRIPYLVPALDIPYSHHERWDGSGYPRGLKGREIPLAARIFAVVDVWDALSNNRPYRPAWPREKVMRYLQDNAGVLFEPDVVRIFLDMIRYSQDE